MTSEHDVKKYAATAIVLVLLAVVLYAVHPFFNALFGSIILLPIFGPVANFFSKKMSRSLAAIITIVLILIIFVVPAGIVSPLLVGEFFHLTGDAELKATLVEGMERITGSQEEADIAISNMITEVQNFVKSALPSLVSSLSNIIIALIIMFFSFYFLVVNHEYFAKNLRVFIPFNDENTERLVREFDRVTTSTVVGLGIIGLAQGILLGLGFWIFGISGPLFWGFITVIISVFPVIGTALVWLPAGIISVILGNYFAGIGILIWGAILVANVDNIIRPIISKRMANLHPMVTIVGVFMGLPVFGIIGIITGPLLLSYLFLTLRMYKEEYL